VAVIVALLVVVTCGVLVAIVIGLMMFAITS